MRISRHFFALFVLIVNFAHAQVPARTPKVHIVFMGGYDCPYCSAWFEYQLPQLQNSPEFAKITFSHVLKPVASSVPELSKLPPEVRPLKDKLDYASTGRRGSPQTAVFVDGEVYDYFHKTRTAEEFEQMLTSIRTGSPYPFMRCLKASREWGKCELAIK